MKTSGLILLVFLCMAMVVSCGGKYDEAEAVLDDYADAAEDYVSDMDKASDAEAVVKAMNDYTAKMADIAPKLQKLYETFPELRTGKELPDELEAFATRMESLGEKIQASMMKTMQYMMDPAVQQAMTAQAQAMAKMGQ